MRHRFLHTRDRVRTLLANLQVAGIDVPRASRWRRYLRELDRIVVVEETRDLTAAEVTLLHRLLIEVEDLEMISTLGNEPPVSGWVPRAQATMRGGVLRTDDGRQSAARNAQFELVVAALFRAGGFQVHIEEPDLRIEDALGCFVIAAKRLRSRSKLEMRIGEARDQITQSGQRGLIAIDLSCIMNPADAAMKTEDLHAAQQELAQAAIQVYRNARERARAKLRHDHVFGLLFYRATPIFDETNSVLTYQRHWAVANTLNATHAQTHNLRQILSRLQDSIKAG